MFALSLGVQKIDRTLPAVVYALLSGLNASTVGIVALAAVQLAEKAIIDKLSRILVLFGACAGLLYNALWYFPVLITAGGIAAGIWDTWLRQKLEKARLRRKQRREAAIRAEEGAAQGVESVDLPSIPPQDSQQARLQRRTNIPQHPETSHQTQPHATSQTNSNQQGTAPEPTHSVDMSTYSVSIPAGALIIAFTLALLIALLVSRSLLPSPVPRPLDLFANMYLAGTVIFGGGPVVIPLLREYVVQPGWVDSRDFLIGLAIIQAFPGPNFNFGVFLGALALRGTPHPTVLGALLGYIGIFFPGVAFVFGVQGMWRILRTKPLVLSLLRGINATAVGLVFTAVYRLWEIGYLTPEASQGQSLAMEPWWLVVAALAYAETCWFKVPAAAAIVGGAVLGLVWYGVTK
jgi:chromate transport protein ChrA